MRLIEKCGLPIDHLESDLQDLCNMAHITAELIEHSIGDKNTQREITGKDHTYFINDGTVDAMHFAVYEVQKKAKALLDKYLTGRGHR